MFSVAFHPKEKLVFATGKDKTIRSWDTTTHKLVSTTKLDRLEYYLRLQVSNDGKRIATYAPAGDTIRIWSFEVK